MEGCCVSEVHANLVRGGLSLCLVLPADESKKHPLQFKPTLSFKGYQPDNGMPQWDSFSLQAQTLPRGANPAV